MRRFIVCAATLWLAQCATQSGLDRRTFVAKAIRRSPTNDDFFGSGGLPKASGLRPKTKKPTPTPAPTTPAPTQATPVPLQRPQQQPAPAPRPNYPPPPPPAQMYQQQGYPPQGYQYPPNYQQYQYYAQQQRPQQPPPQQYQQQQPYYNPYMHYTQYQTQPSQPIMIPVPVPVPMPQMTGLPGIPNMMQPIAAPTSTEKPRKSHKRPRYATLMPPVDEEEMRSSAPVMDEMDAMDRNEVRRAPARKRQQQKYYDNDYSEEETSTAVTMFPTLPTMFPTMAPMKLPTLPPMTLPPSFEKLLGITTPKPQKEKRRKEKRRREYEDEEEYVPVKRRRMEEESRPHGRSLAVEEDRGRRDPFEGTDGFEEQKEEKESAPSVADRLMRKSLSSKKEETGGEEDWLVPFRK